MLEIKAVREGDVVELVATGRLDTLTAPDLEAAVKEAGGAKGLFIDLTDVEYVSSAGLRVLLMAHMQMSGVGDFALRHPNEYVTRVLESTGFTDLLTIEQ